MLGLVSAANCSFKPRIGSRGAISTAVNRDMLGYLWGVEIGVGATRFVRRSKLSILLWAQQVKREKAQRSLPSQHDMSRPRRRLVLGACVPQGRQIDAFKQPFASPQQHRRDGDVQFIDEAQTKVLLDRTDTATNAHIFASSRFPGTLECDFRAFGDEVKGRSALHDQRCTRVVGQHENRHVVYGILAPPTAPTLIRPGSATWPKHVPAQDPGADIAETTCSEVFVDAIFSGIAAEQLLLKGARGKCPGVQRSASDPERLVQSLIRPGAEAVQGDGETLYAKFGHGV